MEIDDRPGSACNDPAVPLLEREHPLQVLQEHARSAVEGRGSLVLVAGEAGIGKTVLLRAFAEGRPAVLWGMCDPLLTPRPFGPLRDIASRLDPAVSDLLRTGAAQHEIFAAVLDALRGAPRVLVVEDLHWGDEATLDLVRFLARRIATLPLLLVLSYRDAVGVRHPLRTVLGDLVSSPDARRHRPRPTTGPTSVPSPCGTTAPPAACRPPWRSSTISAPAPSPRTSAPGCASGVWPWCRAGRWR